MIGLIHRVHRCNSDLNYSQNTQKQLQAANDSLLTDVARHENKQRQLQLECTNLRSKLRTHANEVIVSTFAVHRHFGLEAVWPTCVG